jgi:hemerythrin-like metal-binding protein
MHAIGIPELDAQHEEINELVNSLQELIAANDRQGLVPPTLKRLRQLLATHFEYEESLMQMVSYPELPQHSKMHGRVLQLFDDYFAHPPVAGDDDRSAHLISDKVLGHVMDHDRHLIAMVRDYMKTFRSAPDA